MPQNVTQYDLLISCPGDIKEEIEVINRTVQKFNDQFSDTLGISIRTVSYTHLKAILNFLIKSFPYYPSLEKKQKHIFIQIQTLA